MRHRRTLALAGLSAGLLALALAPDGLGQPGPKGDKDFFNKGFGGGPGGMFGGERKILKQHDKDGDGRLNADERKAAREAIKNQGGPKGGFGKGGPKGGFGMRGKQDPPKPGPRVRPEDVTAHPDKPLYEPTVLRTIFLRFEGADWEAELQDFKGTDVDVPATLTVDGKTYPNVGVHFRGMSSYGMVPAGYKRSLNVSLDFVDPKQRLYGYKTLNLLNNHEDPSNLSTVLYSHVAGQFIPTPKANLVRVVINGESWGVYTSVQQFDKVFVKEHFRADKGARWKVTGNPGGGGGLEYWGDDVEPYKRRFEIKSKDDPKDWKALVNLCKVLNQTPPDRLEEALRPILDVDGLLWFLALDVALVNGDGYWVRASDYSLYLDPKGKFHAVPHDMNEAFRPARGPGMGGPRMFAPGRPGEVLPVPLQDMLGLTAEQKKKLAGLQKDVDAQVETVLTAEQRKQLAELRDRGPGGFGPPPGGPGGFGPPPGGPGGPGGFGPPPRGPGGFGPPPGGPGGFGPPGGGGPMMIPLGGGPGGSAGVDLDPLVALNDPRKPLRSKVLAVPSLRAKYLANVRTIAEKALDWKQLGPVVAGHRRLIEKEVELDTRKLESFEEFVKLTADQPAAERSPGGRGHMSLRAFADQRRKYLLDYKEPKPAK